ncbi:MAG: hypothetical protein HQL11_00585 [Candidatus Omnitrophica bacterium]|nr:hypothetical protein [Candidatus Omnitrophota bacterium]
MRKHIPLLIVMALLTAGCATGRNYQTDLDALNSKVDNLQSQLTAKNRDLAALQDQLRNTQEQLRAAQTQLELASRAKAEAESRLYQALDKLAAQKKSSSSTATTQTVTADKTYIK